MMWLTWRQQRLEVLIGAAVFGLVAAVLLKTGLDMTSAYRNTGLAACLEGQSVNAGCQTAIDSFQNRFGLFESVIGWLNFMPLIVGLLLGAPFVLELEQGTYRLAWTQSITRMRWVTIKLGLIVATALLVSVAFAALMTWWSGPFDQLDGRFRPNAFDFEGTVPFAYALFAVSLAIAVGTVIRKTIPTMGIAIAGFLAIRVWIVDFLRPHFMAPITALASGHGPRHGDWILSGGWSDRLGNQLPDRYVFQVCDPKTHIDKRSMLHCFQTHGIFDSTIYQPAGRFWTFQGIETAIFLGLSVALLALTVWWVKYRIT